MRDPRALTCRRSDPHVTRGTAIDQTEAAFLAPDLVVVIEVRNVSEFFAQANWRVLSINADRGLEGTEVLCEVEMLVLREMLIGKSRPHTAKASLIAWRSAGPILWFAERRACPASPLPDANSPLANWRRSRGTQFLVGAP